MTQGRSWARQTALAISLVFAVILASAALPIWRTSRSAAALARGIAPGSDWATAAARIEANKDWLFVRLQGPEGPLGNVVRLGKGDAFVLSRKSGPGRDEVSVSGLLDPRVVAVKDRASRAGVVFRPMGLGWMSFDVTLDKAGGVEQVTGVHVSD